MFILLDYIRSIRVAFAANSSPMKRMQVSRINFQNDDIPNESITKTKHCFVISQTPMNHSTRTLNHTCVQFAEKLLSMKRITQLTWKLSIQRRTSNVQCVTNHSQSSKFFFYQITLSPRSLVSIPFILIQYCQFLLFFLPEITSSAT